MPQRSASTLLRAGLVALLIPAAVQCGARSSLDKLEIIIEVEAGTVDAAIADSSIDPGPPADAARTIADAAPPPTAPDVAPPRPIAPLSTATVTSHLPILRWSLPTGATGAEIDICRDRACTTRVTTFTAVGSSAAVTTALSQGVYFWRLRGVVNGDVGKANSVVWEFFVGVEDAAQNSSWGTTLDVNGDGFADVAVAAPNLKGATENVYVYIGGPDGLASAPTTMIYPNHPAGYYRAQLASAGDVDGDGYADVIIGVPDLNANQGGVLVYTGGPQGLATTATPLAQPTGADSSFGWSVAGAGDIDGDGYADVIVGAPDTSTNQGAAFVFFGSPQGLATAPTKLVSTTLASGLYAYYGTAVAGIGDIDGDGFADFAVGAIQGKSLFVYFGGARGISAPTVVLEPHTPDHPDMDPNFGSTVAGTGDVNGDGFADLLAGAPGDGDDYIASGAAYLFLGSANGLATSAIPLVPPTADNGLSFGTLIAGAGDVDGDGYADLLGATETDSYLYRGGANGPSTTPTILSIPGGANNAFGSGALAGGGDIDGDGFTDVLVGSPFSNNDVGGVFVYAGTAKGVSGPVPIAHPNVANGLFGAALAL